MQHNHESSEALRLREGLNQKYRTTFPMNDFPRNSQPGDNPGTTPEISTKTGEWKPAWGRPVSFPEWQEILAIEPLDAQTRMRFAQAIISYLRYCRERPKGSCRTLCFLVGCCRVWLSQARCRHDFGRNPGVKDTVAHRAS